jgi:predicted MPP superfamily phosphohydrolase
VDVRGQSLTLVGVACSHNQSLDVQRLRQTLNEIPPSGMTVLLFHSPDLILEASELGVDLFLAGHTHGGQIRLPILGAVVTHSIYGNRYVSGLFHEGDTTMYVSRGLGFEGGWLPRARFLCRPEIVSIELAATSP